jgi:hypothetical protein
MNVDVRASESRRRYHGRSDLVSAARSLGFIAHAGFAGASLTRARTTEFLTLESCAPEVPTCV